MFILYKNVSMFFYKLTPSVQKKDKPWISVSNFDCPSYIKFFYNSYFYYC